MEANDPTEHLSQNHVVVSHGSSSQQSPVVVSHGSSQQSARRGARPIFLPKQPPRPRQRGALPRFMSEADEEAFLTQQRGVSMPYMDQQIPASQSRGIPRPLTEEATLSLHQLCSSMASFEKQTRHAHLPPMEEQTNMPFMQQQTDVSTPFMEESWQGHFLAQKRKNRTPWQRDGLPSAAKFSRSWHRVGTQEQSHQGGTMPLAQEQSYRPRQRGAIRPPFQEQAFQAPNSSFTNTPSSLTTSLAPHPVAQEPRVLQPFLETKSLFSEMWCQLEAAIENRERMLMDMKAEMEKSLSQVKTSQVDALKEKEEVEARKAGALESTENISRQTGKLQSVRESLEQISTDLSVQVAELNRSRQQVEEQQRVLRVLESLKNHYDNSENEDNNFLDKNLQECEVKLATMERELEGSKQTSELLEKAALKRIGDLEEIEAGCVLPVSLVKEASSNLSFVQSQLQINTDTTENFSKTRIDARPFGLNGEPSGHAPALKRPKLEV
eukprot:c24565_g1_i1 orf=176-1663(+)